MRRWHSSQKAVAEIVMDADPNVQGSVAFSSESNVGYAFSIMKPRKERKLYRWTRRSTELRPKVAQVPGIMTFLQNPPPITINGQFTTSVYQMTLQSVSLNDIYDWTPKLTQKIQTLARICGCQQRPSDRQSAGPRRYRSRSRAVPGHHAGTDSGCALQFVWRSAGFEHLRAGKSIRGHP